jgi:two-component system cell cycle response regulator
MTARILVVDDILPNVKLLEAKLTSEYYDVVTAMNGEEALAKAAETNPDLILLDIMMPGMDGFEVCTRLKADPALAHIPVVMVTALTDSQDRVKGLQCGADDFLSKPVNDIALMARVRSLVRLKMAIDEWRARENTATQLGVLQEHTDAEKDGIDPSTILLVEDMDFEINKIKDTIESQDHTLDVVATGMEAIKKTNTTAYDLLIISLNLEHEDGVKLCSHLRSNEKTRNTPILMIGSEDDLEKIARGLEIGAHDYIVRPVDRNELIARMVTQIKRKRFQERLRSSYEVSLSMALTDTLTGLYNRRYFEVHLQKLLKSSKESGKTLAIVYTDIDHFKNVNDTYGHTVGDEILQMFSKRLTEKLRSFDLVARIGGEEFVAVLPDTDEKTAHIVSERLRRAIAEEPFATSHEEPLTITTSIGGVLVEDPNQTITQLLERADAQLYEAKHNGRNTIFFERTGRVDPSVYIPQDRDLSE